MGSITSRSPIESGPTGLEERVLLCLRCIFTARRNLPLRSDECIRLVRLELADEVPAWYVRQFLKRPTFELVDGGWRVAESNFLFEGAET